MTVAHWFTYLGTRRLSFAIFSLVRSEPHFTGDAGRNVVVLLRFLSVAGMIGIGIIAPRKFGQFPIGAASAAFAPGGPCGSGIRHGVANGSARPRHRSPGNSSTPKR